MLLNYTTRFIRQSKSSKFTSIYLLTAKTQGTKLRAKDPEGPTSAIVIPCRFKPIDPTVSRVVRFAKPEG